LFDPKRPDSNAITHLPAAAVEGVLRGHPWLIMSKGHLRPVIRMLSYFIFEYSNAKKIVGEPDHTVKPYAVVVAELCYELQRLIPMPEKTAALYYCHRETFLNKFPKVSQNQSSASASESSIA
jgi:acetyl CoA:N6-hydroxylysine acetyl transferase